MFDFWFFIALVAGNITGLLVFDILKAYFKKRKENKDVSKST